MPAGTTPTERPLEDPVSRVAEPGGNARGARRRLARGSVPVDPGGGSPSKLASVAACPDDANESSERALGARGHERAAGRVGPDLAARGYLPPAKQRAILSLP